MFTTASLLRSARFCFSMVTAGALLFSPALSALAGSATWNVNPPSNDWSTASNWMPNTVPNGPADTATFAGSNTTSVSLAATTQVSSIVFDSGASPFTVSVFGQGTAPSTLTISGAGVINNSGITQQLVAAPAAAGGVGNISLTGNATVGSLMMITNQGGSKLKTAVSITTLTDNASAGDATFINEGGGAGGPEPGETLFAGTATAASASFICTSGVGQAFGAFGGNVRFTASSTAANGTFNLEGGPTANTDGGYATFYDSSTAGDGVFTLNGSDASVGGEAFVQFYGNSTAGNATFIVNDGTVSGGEIDFYGDCSGGTGRFELFGKGTLNLNDFQNGTRTIGSLEGSGVILLGARTLIIGSNPLSTTFSGTIQGTGGVSKIGSGTLTLSGINTYSGATTVSEGVLLVTTQSGSGTGTGPVQVNAGTLGGKGVVSGAVTIGTGSGSGAFLTPAAGSNVSTTFTTTGSLTMNADSTYTYTGRAKGRRVQTDKVVANGVTINGAAFAFRVKVSGNLPAGTVLTAIGNTSASPISGTFVNLADGSTLSAGGVNFAVSYEGGDGNDLTLTVL